MAARVFLLVEENFEKLQEITGISTEVFENWRRYDEAAGLKDTKIVVVPGLPQAVE